jgi:type VII secretion-associated serine protease mycosin
VAVLDRIGRAATAAAAATLIATTVVSPAQADQVRDLQWHLAFLKADQIRKITKGYGVTVAVVDSGVDGEHPDLAGNVLKGKDLVSPSGGDGWEDTEGHGTKMASLIAAHGHGSGRRDGVLGLAPDAKILPVRDHWDRAGARFADKGIRWAVDHGAKVINFSARTEGLTEAVDYALAHDVVVVAGVGNTTQGDDTVGEPASLSGVIAVSGVGKDGKFSKASVEGPAVVLSAPAVDIVGASTTTASKYGVATGTSDATALVSGAVALVRAKYPDLNAASVIERLIATADDQGTEGRDNRYGFGIVNPLKALTATDVPIVEKNPLGGPVSKPTRAKGNPSTSALPAIKSGNKTLVLIGAAGGLAILAVIVGVFIAHRSGRTRPTSSASGWPPPPPGTPPPAGPPP